MYADRMVDIALSPPTRILASVPIDCTTMSLSRCTRGVSLSLISIYTKLKGYYSNEMTVTSMTCPGLTAGMPPVTMATAKSQFLLCASTAHPIPCLYVCMYEVLLRLLHLLPRLLPATRSYNPTTVCCGRWRLGAAERTATSCSYSSCSSHRRTGWYTSPVSHSFRRVAVCKNTTVSSFRTHIPTHAI